MLDAVGNHGHLMFRPHMGEDWIIWGVALSAAITGIFLLTRRKQNPAHDEELFKKYGIKGKILYTSKPSKNFSYMKKLKEYSATRKEIESVENAINQNGFWEDNIEWRISTVMTSRIEPKIENEKKWFITTVKCEQEVMIPAVSIERAIIFMKAYQDFQMELWREQGWASQTKDNR